MAKKNLRSLKPTIKEVGKTGNRKSDRAKVAYKWLENVETAGISEGKQYNQIVKKQIRTAKKVDKK